MSILHTCKSLYGCEIELYKTGCVECGMEWEWNMQWNVEWIYSRQHTETIGR